MPIIIIIKIQITSVHFTKASIKRIYHLTENDYQLIIITYYTHD